MNTTVIKHQIMQKVAPAWHKQELEDAGGLVHVVVLKKALETGTGIYPIGTFGLLVSSCDRTTLTPCFTFIDGVRGFGHRISLETAKTHIAVLP